MDRRRFIEQVGRFGVLGLLLALVAVFFVRKQVSAKSSSCGMPGGCSGCNKVNSCSLPEAKKGIENGER